MGKIAWIVCVLFCSYGLAIGENRALIVAISRYPEAGGWLDIHAVNDTALLLPLLKEKGYQAENIALLLNEKATKEGIVRAFTKLARQSKKGDYLYIHFSCHGQQMVDDNGDEADGLDEALIPYDACRRYTKGKYEGEKHLRDDELEVLLDRLRAAVGPSGRLIVVLDACHSATATRESDDDYIRGTSYVFGAADDFEPLSLPVTSGNWQIRRSPRLAPIHVFSACQADESNCEYRFKEAGSGTVHYCGSLSYAFVRQVSKAGKNTSSQAFFEQVKKEMQDMFRHRIRKQTPYFESTDDETIFSLGQ